MTWRRPVRLAILSSTAAGSTTRSSFCVCAWYVSYKLSYRDLVEMMADRGLSVSHTTVMQWTVRYAPEFEQKWRRYERRVGDSWRVDETYVKVSGRWVFLYRGVGRQGKTVEFYLSPRRDRAAATAFFRQALRHHGEPRGRYARCLRTEPFRVATDALFRSPSVPFLGPTPFLSPLLLAGTATWESCQRACGLRASASANAQPPTARCIAGHLELPVEQPSTNGREAASVSGLLTLGRSLAQRETLVIAGRT